MELMIGKPRDEAVERIAAGREMRRGPVLAIILLTYLMIVLDISIVITALPKIHDGLRFTDTGLSWVQNAYTIAFGGLLLLGARAGDILGRRRMLLAGLAVFTIASLAAGLAGSPGSRRNTGPPPGIRPPNRGTG